jgi:ribosomal-protein-alanine N-acetyltransferase
METNFPILHTARLLLRQIVDTDLENIFKGLSHPEVVRYYGVRFRTQEATKAQMSWFANLEAGQTGIWWAICERESGEFMGSCGFYNLSKAHRKGEVGLWLLPEYWGKGTMTETMRLICEYGFTELNLHRIEGFVETENTGCKKALNKLAFTHEGTMKDCEWKDGRFISVDVYAKFRN